MTGLRRGDWAYIFKSRWKRFAAGMLDTAGRAVFGAKSEKTSGAAPVRRILVVRMDQLGDAVFAAPAVAVLHEIFPDASIDFLCGPWAAPLVRQFPGVSRAVVFEDNWFAPRRRFLKSLRNARAVAQKMRANAYDLGIDLRGDFRNILLMKAAKIHRIAGYGVTGGGFLLDFIPPYDFSAHQVDLNLRLACEAARAAGGKARIVPAKEQRPPQFACPQEALQAVRKRGWITGRSPHILIHMEAGYPSKRWNPARFRELLGRLANRGYALTLIGIKADSPWDDSRVQDLRGKTGLLELCGLIAQSDLLIGNDSAPVHIAAALGTPCVVLFSAANEPARWRPVGEQVRLLFHSVPCSPCESRKCLRPTHECMDAVTVDAVEALAGEILNNGKDRAV